MNDGRYRIDKRRLRELHAAGLSRRQIAVRPGAKVDSVKKALKRIRQ